MLKKSSGSFLGWERGEGLGTLSLSSSARRFAKRGGPSKQSSLVRMYTSEGGGGVSLIIVSWTADEEMGPAVEKLTTEV